MIDNESPVLEFTAQDRCDRCGAQAYSMARHEDYTAELLFCLHDRKKHYDALLDAGWEIVDDYEGITRLAEQEGVPV